MKWAKLYHEDSDKKEKNPSIHGSKDIRRLKSVMYGQTDEQTDGKTNLKQYALPTSSSWGHKMKQEINNRYWKS